MSACPVCKGELPPQRPIGLGPFCSARCQSSDLGQWLQEKYKVSEPISPETLEFEIDENAEGLD